jgi:hypothetical protein
MGEDGTKRLAPSQRVAMLQSMANSGKRLELDTVGFSMAPLVQPSSSVQIEFAPEQEVVAGDVILFHRGESLVLHRVLKRLRRGGAMCFIEKGDHQPMYSVIPADCYLARLVAIRTGDRVFDTTSLRGRLVSRVLLCGSWLEKLAYDLKTKLFGNRPLPGGKQLMAIGTRLRRWLQRPALHKHHDH